MRPVNSEAVQSPSEKHRSAVVPDRRYVRFSTLVIFDSSVLCSKAVRTSGKKAFSVYRNSNYYFECHFIRSVSRTHCEPLRIRASTRLGDGKGNRLSRLFVSFVGLSLSMLFCFYSFITVELQCFKFILLLTAFYIFPDYIIVQSLN